MVDYRIILQILHSHVLDCASTLMVSEKRDFVNDDNVIIFPAADYHYQDKINSLSALQYLQRTRILYTTLLKAN
jgi:hypothetical protein